MGQYWKMASLTKREYLDPWKLGSGGKWWEQALTSVGPMQALLVLVTDPRCNDRVEDDQQIALGRWFGDAIVFVGDGPDDLEYDKLSDGGTDITELVMPVLEATFHGKFVRTNGVTDWAYSGHGFR